jgi:hypothetical protein
VPEYDAFGREIGDDPLKSFSGAPPRPEPVVSAPPPTPSRRRRRGSARWLVVAAVLGVGLVTVANVGVKVEGGIEDVVEGVGAAPPTGVKGDSLIREANFAMAVAVLKSSGLGKPLTMRVAPDRIDATLVSNGRMHEVQVTPSGELHENAVVAAPPGRTIPYAAIDTAAPQRLVRAGATKQVPAGRIDYLVVTAGPPVSWGAYYKGGRIVIGDAHGRKQRVL